MNGEHMFVTGMVGVPPGTDFAKEVAGAFATAAGKGLATFYVLGSLFAPGTPKDAMIVYLEGLPGRKVLVTDQGRASDDEFTCGAWHEVTNQIMLRQWGKNIRITCDPPVHNPNLGLLLHIGKRPDSESCIRVLWDDWDGRFGPAGLSSIYALSVLADQIGAGMIAAMEPEDGR